MASVTILEGEYHLESGGSLALALDIHPLLSAGDGEPSVGAQTRAGAVCLAVLCPALRRQLGMPPYQGAPHEYGGRIVDALAIPSRRGTRQAQAQPAVPMPQIIEACGIALSEALSALTTEAEVEEAARPTEPTP